MPGLLGPVGELWPLKCAASLRVSDGPRGTAVRMLSGLVRYQHAPTPRRVWDVSVATATPEEAATLAHRAGRRGDVSRPWWFLSEEAQTANMLTPGVSMLEEGHRSGGSRATVSATLFSSTDGWRPLSVATQGGSGSIIFASSATGISAAIPHDTTFTASVYFTRPAGGEDSSFRVEEIDQTGTVTHTHYARCRTDDALTRLVITATTQTTTVAVRLVAYKPLAVADPCLTLTDRALPYAVGQGCSRSVLHEASHDVQRATTMAWDRRSAWDYQIMEVG